LSIYIFIYFHLFFLPDAKSEHSFWLGWQNSFLLKMFFIHVLFVYVDKLLKICWIFFCCKGSSLQLMIPLHSLPMGIVCNFLEYKSCIIHVYRQTTSINYVFLFRCLYFYNDIFFPA